MNKIMVMRKIMMTKILIFEKIVKNNNICVIINSQQGRI